VRDTVYSLLVFAVLLRTAAYRTPTEGGGSNREERGF
jgi:hypothetical protein